MKIFKICFIITFLLCSFQGKSSIVIDRCITNEYDIEQSPLSDDQTNPINEHITEVADIDLEEIDENNSFFPHILNTAFINSKIVYSFTTSCFLISSNQSPQFSFRKIFQSYLKVFRI